MENNESLDSQIIFSIADMVRNFNPDDLENSYDKIFNLLKEIIDFTYSALFLYNKSEHKIELITKKGKFVDLIELVSFELGKGFSAWVAKNKKTVLLNNLKKKTSSFAKKRDIKSFLSIPLLIENNLVGVINFAHEDKYAFDEKKIPTLEVIATLLATLIYRFQVIKEVTEKNKEISLVNKKLEEAQEKVVKMERIGAITATVISLKHEINNPLMVIKGHLTLLENELKKNDLPNDRIKKINEEVDRVSQILLKIENIRDPEYKEYVDGVGDDMLLDLSKD